MATLAKHIAVARGHLQVGNPEAYKRAMSGLLRSAMSTRSTRQIEAAAAEDGFGKKDFAA